MRSIPASATIGAAPAAVILLAVSAAAQMAVSTHQVTEFTFTSRVQHAEPMGISLDATVSTPGGRELRVPGFWGGEKTWKVRYASGETGLHVLRTECTGADDAGLHDQRREVRITEYRGNNPLYRHGPIRVSGDRRHFEHADGTPFLWLGDTWWMGLTKRLRWPDEFRQLAADRTAKGFNLIQIVAGLYPDMPAFDPRGENEAGFPWTRDYRAINPAYFDRADERIAHLVDSGLVPCIVSAWGYHLPWMGVEPLKQHWRYLVARYGAYPVVWCLAGEGAMPYYLSKSKQVDKERQIEGWTQIGRYVRQIDPYHRIVSIHPIDTARRMVSDLSILDFDMLQTGHGDAASMPGMIRALRESRSATPPMPTVNSEVCYEGILGRCHEEIQRFSVWGGFLSGAAGHTYGANGIWQVNRREQPYGKSPHGGDWGQTPWDEAMKLPGSRQVGLARKLLERFEWWRFEPHPDWISLELPKESPLRASGKEAMATPFAAGIPREVRIIYLPAAGTARVSGLEKGSRYQAAWLNPPNGDETAAVSVDSDEGGTWHVHTPAGSSDWILLLTRRPE